MEKGFGKIYLDFNDLIKNGIVPEDALLFDVVITGDKNAIDISYYTKYGREYNQAQRAKVLIS